MFNKTLVNSFQLKNIIPLRRSQGLFNGQINWAINSVGFKTCPADESFLHFEVTDADAGTELFLSLFSDIGCNELIPLQKIAEEFKFLNFERLCRRFHHQWNDQAFRVALEANTRWSEEISSWAWEKKIKTQDLACLMLLKETDRENLLQQVCQSPLSKTQVLQGLEWISELLMMQQPVDSQLMTLPSENALAEVKKLRFPMSLNFHPLKSLSLHWPSQASSQFVRQQDKAGFEVKFFVSDALELEKIIQQLEATKTEWKRHV